MPTRRDQPVLSLRQLNRTTLARQLLLEREALPAAQGVERLVGMQAQLARNWQSRSVRPKRKARSSSS